MQLVSLISIEAIANQILIRLVSCDHSNFVLCLYFHFVLFLLFLFFRYVCSLAVSCQCVCVCRRSPCSKYSLYSHHSHNTAWVINKSECLHLLEPKSCLYLIHYPRDSFGTLSATMNGIFFAHAFCRWKKQRKEK